MFGLEDDLQTKIKELEGKILQFKIILSKIRIQEESFYTDDKTFSLEDFINERKSIEALYDQYFGIITTREGNVKENAS